MNLYNEHQVKAAFLGAITKVSEVSSFQEVEKSLEPINLLMKMMY